MHFDLSLAGIAFRLTIFGLLLTKLMQISRNYIIPYLLDQIKQERAIRTELIEKENFITSTQNRVENQLRNQKKTFEDLEKNVQKWHTSLQHEKELTEKQLIDIKNKIEKKRTTQRKNYIKAATYACIVPQAIELAHQELSLNCLADSGKHLFEKLINKLNK
jgi:lipoate-protein ligase A